MVTPDVVEQPPRWGRSPSDSRLLCRMKWHSVSGSRRNDLARKGRRARLGRDYPNVSSQVLTAISRLFSSIRTTPSAGVSVELIAVATALARRPDPARRVGGVHSAHPQIDDAYRVVPSSWVADRHEVGNPWPALLR